MTWESILWGAAIGLTVGVIGYVYSWMRRRATDRLLDRCVADGKAGKAAVSLEDPKNGTISVSQEGFTLLKDGRLLVEVRWDEVTEIKAYKADLGIVDRIYWVFSRSPDSPDVEVHEEMSGFRALQESVKSRFGVSLEDWFTEVAFPAFATNLKVIWPKKNCASM